MLFSLLTLCLALTAALRAVSVFKLVLNEMRVWCDAGQVKPGRSLVPELLIQFKLPDINCILAGRLGAGGGGGKGTFLRDWRL